MIGAPIYFDKDGKPLELMEWAKLSEDREYARIGLTKFDSGIQVSTIWMGLDFNPFTGTKHTFETAILNTEGFDRVFGRCGTVEDAEAMHEEAVAEYKSQL